MELVHIPVYGMTCGGCVRMVERRLQSIAGVSSAKASLEQHSALVHYDPQRTSPDRLTEAVAGLGYEVAAPPAR